MLEERDYIKLKLKRDLLRLIFDMRVYREMGECRKRVFENYLDYLRGFDNPLDRMNKFLASSDAGLLDFSDLNDRVKDRKIARELATRYPEHREVIFGLVQEIESLPKIDSLPLELDSYITDAANFPISTYHMRKLIIEILKRLPYKNGSIEHKALLKRSNLDGYFKAYFKRNDLPKEEYQKNFEELIGFLLIGFPILIDKQIPREALKICVDGGATITASIVDQFLKNKIGYGHEIQPRILKTLRSLGVKLSFDLYGFIESRISEAKSLHPDLDDNIIIMQIVHVFINLIDVVELMDVLSNIISPETAPVLSHMLFNKYPDADVKAAFAEAFFRKTVDKQKPKQQGAFVLGPIKDNSQSK